MRWSIVEHCADDEASLAEVVMARLETQDRRIEAQDRRIAELEQHIERLEADGHAAAEQTRKGAAIVVDAMEMFMTGLGR